MPGEDLEAIKKKTEELLSIDSEKEKINMNIKKSKGFEEKIISVIEVELKKSSHTNTFLKNLNKSLNKEQKALLLRQIESRLDETNHFYIRLSKKDLLNDKYNIIDKGDCFHITMSIASYPSSRSRAIEVINEIFK